MLPHYTAKGDTETTVEKPQFYLENMLLKYAKRIKYHNRDFDAEKSFSKYYYTNQAVATATANKIKTLAGMPKRKF